MSLCNECDKCHLCTSLCPEAELYAKQDEVYRREKTIGLPTYKDKPWPEPRPFFTPREQQVLSLLLKGKTRDEIRQVLNITGENMKKVIKRLRQKGQKFTNSMGIERQETKEIAEEEIPKEAN